MKIYNEIISIIEKDKYAAASVEESSNLYTDLGFDSLSFIRLLLKIEKIYSITFDISEMESCLQVCRLVDIVKSKMKNYNI